MAGVTIPLITMRIFDFASLAAASEQTIILIKEFDVSPWTEGTLNVRVHGGSIDTTATAKISIALHATAPTPEDPTHTFTDSTAVANIDVTDEDVSAAPKLMRTSLSSGFGGKLMLVVVGTQDSAAMLTNLRAELSAEVVLKN